MVWVISIDFGGFFPAAGRPGGYRAGHPALVERHPEEFRRPEAIEGARKVIDPFGDRSMAAGARFRLERG